MTGTDRNAENAETTLTDRYGAGVDGAVKRAATETMLRVVNTWHREVGIDDILKSRLTLKIADVVASSVFDGAFAEMAREIERLRAAPAVEFHQQDWIPGFAAFCPDATTPPPQSRAFCVLNLGSILATVEAGHVEKSEVPYFVAESMMHEIMHALEQWAAVEFSEERIEALLERYRAATLPTPESSHD